MSDEAYQRTGQAMAQMAIAEQRLASQHHPKTWSQVDQFDCQLWTAHDNNVDGTHIVPYALCVVCLTEWEQWRLDRASERRAAAALAEGIE